MSKPLPVAFTHCPACGALRTEPGENPLRCNKCGFVFHFGPITAVAAIVTDSEDRVLFLRRAKEPGKGKLGMPGGFVDIGESLETALVREVMEESNLTAIEWAYLVSFPNDYQYRGTVVSVTDMFFICRVESFDELKPQEGEVTSFEFHRPKPEVLAEMAFASNRKALEYFLKQRG